MTGLMKSLKEERMSDNCPQRFWMVYVEGKASPAQRHLTEESAATEAERLAGLPDNRGRWVHLLLASRACRYPPSALEWVLTEQVRREEESGLITPGGDDEWSYEEGLQEINRLRQEDSFNAGWPTEEKG